MAFWDDVGDWTFDDTAYPSLQPASPSGKGKKKRKQSNSSFKVSDEELLRPVKLRAGSKSGAHPERFQTHMEASTSAATVPAAATHSSRQKVSRADGPPAPVGKNSKKGQLQKQQWGQLQQHAQKLPETEQQQQQQQPKQQQSKPSKASQKKEHHLSNAPEQHKRNPAPTVMHPSTACTGPTADGTQAPAPAAEDTADGQQSSKKKKKNKMQKSEQAAAPLDPQVPDSINAPPQQPNPSNKPGHHQKQISSKTLKRQPNTPPSSAPVSSQQTAHNPPSSTNLPAAQASIPANTAGVPRSSSAPTSAAAPARPTSKLLQKMKERLQGGAFRHLNELLYTTPGDESFKEMQKDPSLFQQYHEGFQSQTKLWPMQPVQVAIKWLSSRSPSWTVADFGCGDALLARSVPQTVHSLDLVATAPGVIACNMAATPLDTASVDAAVFCLSLMGTDYGKFLEEACRVLKPTGWLWIAEVRSRFAMDNEKDDLKPFVRCLTQLGFQMEKKDVSNSHFVLLVLRKNAGAKLQQEAIRWPQLKACVYKKR